MSFRLQQNPLLWAEFWVIILTTLFCIVLTALRFVATRRSKRAPGLEDWMTLAALVSLIVMALSALLSLLPGNGIDSKPLAAHDPETFAVSRRWVWICLCAYYCNLLFTKLSVLALYYRIFGVERLYTRWIYLLASFQMVWFAIMFILHGCQCRPVYKFWRPDVAGECIKEGIMILFAEVPNSIMDFVMVALVMFMVRPLQINKSTKWRLRILFGLGGLVGVLGIIKSGITYNNDSIYAFANLGLFSFVQSFVAMFCCCAPVIHSMLPANGIFSRLSSSTADLARRSWWASRIGGSGESSKRQGIATSSGQAHRYSYLNEQSTQELVFPEATYKGSAYALTGVSSNRSYSNQPGVRVERSVSVG